MKRGIKDDFDKLGEKLLRDNDRDFKQHVEFLATLQWSLITTILCAFTAFFAVQLMSFLNYLKRKKRQARNDIVVKVDEMQGGEAHYLCSMFTAGNFNDATTSVTTLHLIGRAFPGRIHDVRQCKVNEVYQMFAPWCVEKILVKEDVELDPILGLTIKTNQYGVHPIWNCKSIVVRNLHSNNAWYFKIPKENCEIGYAQAFTPEVPESLLTFKFCFLRRVRREIRGGQHVYFGFWAWHPSSAYTKAQRIVTKLVAHSCLVSFCVVGLSIIFPPGYESTAGVFRKLTPEDQQVPDSYGVKTWGWSLEGETYFSIWMYEIFMSAIFSCFVTTFLGLLLVLHFRQQGKYERRSNEMDYCVATALRQLSIAKRVEASKENWRKENIQKAYKLTAEAFLHEIIKHTASPSKVDTESKSSKRKVQQILSNISTPKSKYPPREVLFEPGGETPTASMTNFEVGHLDAVPLELLANLTPAEARARQRLLFIGQRYKKDKRYTQFFNLPPINATDISTKFLGNSLMAENFRKARNTNKNTKVNTQTTTPVRSAYSVENPSRELFRAQASTTSKQSRKDEGTMTVKPTGSQSTSSHKAFYKEVYFLNRSYNKDRPKFHVVVPELKFPTYGVNMNSNDPCQEVIDVLPGEAPKHKRSWYNPRGAWVIALALMTTSIAGTSLMCVLDPSNNVHPALFFLLLTTTYVVALTLSYIAFEPIKIVIVAAFYACNDRRLHRDVLANSIVPESIDFQYQH